MGRRNYCISSGLITASGAAALIVSTTRGALCSVNSIIATTGNISIFGYDNSSTGTGLLVYQEKITSATVMGTSGGSRLNVLPSPIAFQSGLTFTITGTAPDGAIIGYESGAY
jgi:hypothetical protein